MNNSETQLVELVKTTTLDGVRLDGVWVAASVPATRVDAIICLHGVGSNFYGSGLFDDLQPSLLAAGCSLLRVNTRGRDGFYQAYLPTGVKRLGAAYERVDECRWDLAAWIEFLLQRGAQRIGLLGHSLGAIKTLYYLAHAPASPTKAAVQWGIVLSPPRLSAEAFRNAPESGRYDEALASARQLVDAGQGETLVEVRFPFPMLITADGYLNKYGPGERFNFLTFAERISCPVLFGYGGLELESGGIAFAGLPDAIQEMQQRGAPFRVVTIPGADHNYTGQRGVLAREIVGQWLV